MGFFYILLLGPKSLEVCIKYVSYLNAHLFTETGTHGLRYTDKYANGFGRKGKEREGKGREPMVLESD